MNYTVIKERSGSNVSQHYYATNNLITQEMIQVAESEYVSSEWICEEIKNGHLIIPSNINHKNLKPIAIGNNVRCKINANIGNSSITSDIANEIHKLEIAVKYGSDAVMDLSTGGNINEIRKAIIDYSTVPIGTVPIYQALSLVEHAYELTPAMLLDIIEQQAQQGVDFMTIHCGLLIRFLPLIKSRITGIVSRGGSLMAQWMLYHHKENPFYTHFNELLEICSKYDVSLSLGDGLRPGCLADASDNAQFAELSVLGELTKKCWEKNVQVMIEGPGHVPFDQIEMNVKKQQEICHGAPFYVLGPLVTDIAPGYDHITSAIGATMAGFSGASMLCYVTPKEHLGLPDLEDVRQGVIAYKIAAHAVDVARKRPNARLRDDNISKARYSFDWEKQFEYSLDPERAKEYHVASFQGKPFKADKYCSMCGPKYCAMSVTKQLEELNNEEFVNHVSNIQKEFKNNL